MPLTMFDLLEGALNELGGKDFSRFTRKLTDPGVQPRVPKSAVEDKDRGDIVELMVEQFTEQGALDTSLKILTSIGANQTATNLVTNAKANGFSPSAGSGESPSTATPSPGGPPSAVTPNADASKAAFIDDKWVELVERATAMNATLDILLSKRVINDEQYSGLRSKQTEQDKMRCLITEALRACGASGKVVLYDVLMAKHPYMMKDLGAS